MAETDDFDFSDLPPETQEWVSRAAARTGDSPDVVIQNFCQLIHDMSAPEANPKAPRILDENILRGIRLALASINARPLAAIDRLLATPALPPLPEDEDQVPGYRIDDAMEEATAIYGQLLKIVLEKGGNAPFGEFPVRVLLAFWHQAAFPSDTSD